MEGASDLGHWPSAPEPVREQLGALVAGLRERLGPDLVGVYLHGSLAMGGFTLAQGDVDLLVVARRRLPPDTKRAVAELLLRTSDAPAGVELSILSEGDLSPWTFPTPFDFHYSEMWRERLTADLASGAWHRWNEPPLSTRRDPDLAAHVAMVLARGAALAGPPAQRVFPRVPGAHLVGALLPEVKSFGETDIDAVLNACRLLAYLREGALLSKVEGGQWALLALPADARPAVQQALGSYRGGAVTPFAPLPLARFADYVGSELVRLTDWSRQEQ